MLWVCGTSLIGQSSKLKENHSVWYHWRLVEEALWFRSAGGGRRFVVRLECVMSRGKFWIVTNIIQELLVLYSFLSLHSTFTISTSHEDKEVFSGYQTRWCGSKLKLHLKPGGRLSSSTCRSTVTYRVIITDLCKLWWWWALHSTHYKPIG